MKKSPDAFRTISEVAAWLETPAHVLRFWESRFPELKPVQRAGGRRYYRRDDMLLLGGIKHLLHTEGHTIKSVQDRIAADGTSAVAAFSQPLGSAGTDDVDSAVGAFDPANAEDKPADSAADMRPGSSSQEARTEHDAPPIGFFFDDSDDAAPAEEQSGTFAQPLTADAAPHPAANAMAEADVTVARIPDDPHAEDAPAADSPAPDLQPRLGALPDLPDDAADDAADFGTVLALSARLRAVHPDDVPAPHRIMLAGLYRRLEGWRRATG